MATNDIPLKVSDSTERVSLRVSDGRSIRSITPDSGSPYYVGARAYVTQTDSGAVVTVIDKDGTTTATILNGADGEDGNGIASIVMNDDYTLTIIMDDGTSLTTDPIKGEDGADGYTPIKGVDYFDGVDGQDGQDGQDGYTPIKGVDYFDGVDGKDGKDGKDGTDGQDGYTPIKGVDYFDGEDGADGKDGTDGQDGFSPSASVTKVGDTATITITDKDGTTTATVSDGTDGTDGRDVFYGTCDTEAATAEKVVACSDFTAEDLKAGAMILVHFNATNSGAVASLSLNVNNTGAKNVKYINNGTLGNLTSAGYLKANTTYLFVYDGTYWVVYLNYNTTYSSMTDAEYQAGTSTTARTITPARLKAAIQYHETPVSITRYTTSGTNIADLTIGDTTTKLYAPTGGGGGGITDVTVDGTSVVQGTVAAVDLTGKSDIGHTHTKSAITDFPTIPSKTSDLTNDSGFITGYTETDPVFSASAAHGISSSDITSWNGKYAKPSGGIPKTDLASAVQTSLGKADSALQSYTETDPTVPSWAKASSKPSYTAGEVGAVPTSRKVNGKALSADITLSASDVSALPSSTSIPSKTSDLTNDSGFITGYTETDPTVPAWAKAASKPTYTASEVGALPSTTSIPSKTSDLTNDSGFITANDVPTEVFWATYGTTTSAELEAAYQAGKIVALLKDNAFSMTVVYLLGARSSTSHYFYRVATSICYWARCTNDVWADGTFDIVPTSRTINNKALSSDITLTASDVGALPDTTQIQTIYASTVAPTSADGEDGDVWFVY